MINSSHTSEQTDVDEPETAARLYVQQLRVFYVHAAVFAGWMALMFSMNLAINLSAGIAGEWSAWWSIWALLGWGAGVGVHGFVVRLARPRPPTSTWEQKQLDKVLAR